MYNLYNLPHPINREEDTITHISYPEQHIIGVGGVVSGWRFYGPFPTRNKAVIWANMNLKQPSNYSIIPLNNVRDE